MFPYPLGVVTLLQGLYSLFWIAVLLDVASPAFNIQRLPEWTGIELALAVTVLFGAASVIGVVMHTVSRSVFRRQKDLWEFKILTSTAVGRRFSKAGVRDTGVGGPTLAEILDQADSDRVRKAGEFMHTLDYVVMAHAPQVFRTIQVYRDQYRLARGFVLPSLAIALVIPFWEPVRLMDGARHVGPFSPIGLQLLLMALLVACVTFLAFRERAFRYAAARVMSFIALEDKRKT